MIETHLWLAVALAVLATWRVTHLVAREDGPFHVFVRVRRFLGQGFWGTLMDCFTCLSVWVAAGVALIITRDLRDWTLLWLGLSGAACLLERITEKPVVFHPLPDSTSFPHELLRPTENGFTPNDAIPPRSNEPVGRS